MKVGDTRAVTIVGAGLAGSLLALLLARQGHRVELFERHPDARRAGAPAGRSINLALAERGRHALRLAGLMDTVDEFTIPMRGRMLHDEQGRLTLQPYGASAGEVIWSTHRALLNRTLLDAVEATGRVSVHFDHRLSGIDFDRDELQFEGDQSPRSFEVLVGADGGGSAVRKALDRQQSLGVREELLDHGYRELTLPPGPDGEFQLDPYALHIWPRGGYMLIGLPNADRSFTMTLFLANRGTSPSFESLDRWEDFDSFCQGDFADVYPMLTGLRDDFENPVGLLGTIRCSRWRLDGRAVLLGDAAHAVVPFHGQGMNAAFEDCALLAELAADAGADWDEVFEAFEARRRVNANAIADMALENYAIMRDAVRDPRFLLRKALEHELERRHPGQFVARYSLVMFHRIPYAEAQQRGRVQAHILDRLLDGVSSVDEVDWLAANDLIAAQLEPLQEAVTGS